MRCFLEVIVHQRSFVKYSFFELPEKPRAYKLFAIHGSFCEIDVFPLSVFSVCNFSLRNLKGNGNAASSDKSSNFLDRL